MRLKAGNGILFNQKNYLTWFEFWHPAKAAALKAEQEYNKSVIEANKAQDELEKDASITLTKLDNNMIIIIVVVAVVGIIALKRSRK